ncbi:hypothetical protein C8F04DRAFT_1304089 [Mycena alexandri]|uniref:Secreted protein n=1 Tax=Mycena alexandri TaxID=1745969 RepID=A0AAD6TA47_9AGAR|nr:hypothetical protein C8F04DRAFT_1304089 [Mycena alexandri]
MRGTDVRGRPSLVVVGIITLVLRVGAPDACCTLPQASRGRERVQDDMTRVPAPRTLSSNRASSIPGLDCADAHVKAGVVNRVVALLTSGTSAGPLYVDVEGLPCLCISTTALGPPSCHNKTTLLALTVVSRLAHAAVALLLLAP